VDAASGLSDFVIGGCAAYAVKSPFPRNRAKSLQMGWSALL